jgi:hypothetical protein
MFSAVLTLSAVVTRPSECHLQFQHSSVATRSRACYLQYQHCLLWLPDPENVLSSFNTVCCGCQTQRVSSAVSTLLWQPDLVHNTCSFNTLSCGYQTQRMFYAVLTLSAVVTRPSRCHLQFQHSSVATRSSA